MQWRRPTAHGRLLLVSYRPLGPQRLGFLRLGSRSRIVGYRNGPRAILALACIGAANAGSALAEGTTPLTAANFDDFVERAGRKTAMVRFIASEG